jgi:hypothetical protein
MTFHVSVEISFAVVSSTVIVGSRFGHVVEERFKQGRSTTNHATIALMPIAHGRRNRRDFPLKGHDAT